MTSTEISARILERSEDSAGSPVTASAAEVLAAINEGQDLFAWLTLSIEREATVAISAGQAHGSIRDTISDFLVPLRVYAVGIGRVRPSTLAEFDALDDLWQARPYTAGAQYRYATRGFNYFGLTPQPTGTLNTAWTYAAAPTTMTLGMTPEIPEAHHGHLVDYGRYRIRLKEGGAGLERGLTHLNRFLDGAAAAGDSVRAKARKLRYDTLPFDLSRYKRSELIKMLALGKK